jgi:hypothetical protein
LNTLPFRFAEWSIDIVFRNGGRAGHRLRLDHQIVVFREKLASTLDSPHCSPRRKTAFFDCQCMAYRGILIDVGTAFHGRGDSGVTQSDETEISQRLRATLQPFFQDLPPDYTARRSVLLEAHRVFREELASALEPALNAHLATMPQHSYEEKKDLAKWINAELRQFGLAIRDPKSGGRSILQGNPGDDPHIGRFRLDHTDNSGKRHYPVNAVVLPQLALMPDDLTRTPYGTGGHRSR